MNDKQKKAIISNLDSLLFDINDKIQNQFSGDNFKIIGLALNIDKTDIMYIVIELNEPVTKLHYISRAFMHNNFKEIK